MSKDPSAASTMESLVDASSELPTKASLNERLANDKHNGDTVTQALTQGDDGSKPKVGVNQYPTYICINEYTKRMEDELDIRPGDKIQVITGDDEYNDGWYFGRNLRTGEEGLYPVNFTQVINIERNNGLYRAKSDKRPASSMPEMKGLKIGDKNNGLNLGDMTLTLSQQSSTSSLDRKHDSLKTTMNDIDRALEAFKLEGSAPIDRGIEEEDDDEGPVDATGRASQVLNSGGHLEDTSDIIGSLSVDDNSVADDSPNNALSSSGSTAFDLDHVEGWSPEEVSRYFITCGFDSQIAAKFAQHKVTGKILLELELSHLKELDISSFGTRFEIFKEIEALKETIKLAHSGTSKGLMPAAKVSQHTGRLSNNKLGSHSSENLAATMRAGSEGLANIRNRPISVYANGISSETNRGRDYGLMGALTEEANGDEVNDNNLFVSPRSAPKPPSYPSPVQPPKSPLAGIGIGFGSVINSRPNTSPPSPMNNKRMSFASVGFKYNTTTVLRTRMQNEPSDSEGSGNVDDSDGLIDGSDDGIDGIDGIGSQNPHSFTAVSSPGSGVSSRSRSHSHSVVTPKKRDFPFKLKFHAVTSPSDIHSPSSGGIISGPRPSSSVYLTGAEPGPGTPHSLQEFPTDSDATPTTRKLKRNSSVSSYFSTYTHNVDRSKLTPKNNRTTPGQGSSSGSARKMDGFISSPLRKEFTDNADRMTPTSARSSTPRSLQLSPKSEKSTSLTNIRLASASTETPKKSSIEEDKKKRSISEGTKGRKLTVKRTSMKKQQTSAFTEGIRNITVKEAMKTADYSGWMSKKGAGAMSTWKMRFFTLHGTRLSYFSSMSDTREKGLIDITAHRVVPAADDDKFVSLYAASTGKGRYCFKLIPPQPGSKKGLTFTQPRVHYFAVDTKEEMRGWMTALIKTTIDIDTSVPIVTSYTTPTVSLSKAKEMQALAREETRRREEQNLLNNQTDEDEALWNEQQKKSAGRKEGESNHSYDEKSHSDSLEEGRLSYVNTLSTAGTTVGSNGFTSPYYLASGMLTPKVYRSGSGRGTQSKESEDKLPAQS